ncbi:MAG: hypothetical protein SPK50_06750 [Mobiluncus porci]|uniref:Glycosyltransferase family 4 protein n=1 Tax=Mobiluncus porci TaxID=2652278 RepID=A0A7K0K3I4_9ACTO|nr:hypothetical protein [Mobiluncus porci]MDD7542515.1 hypothetical protein [Mobiluncus porci]MDY5748812.1 hypothetical protein [Mobiluncus porci]MST50043.1 glycosyltransferase family 4 protein [Mobiluncus porci]
MLLVSYSPLVSDARILKQITLFKDDFELTTCGYGPAPEGVAHHFQIPDDCVYWKRNRLWTILRLYTKAYWSSSASAWCRENVPRDHYDVTFADDIDSIGFGLWTRPKLGLHADLHEYSPREKEDVWRWRVFVKPYMQWQVRHFVARAQTCSTTASFFATEYQRNFGINPTVVVNATPFHELQPTPTPESDPIRLVHAGTCRPDRYTEIMIDAVAGLPDRYTLDLFLVKNDAAYFEKLREKCRGLPNVTLHEGAPYRELIDTLHRYDLGIHNLPPVNFNNQYALPNKFFDFVQARIGMVIGPTPEMVSRLEKYHLGRVAADFTAEALQEALAATTREEVAAWKKNAHAVARELSSENVVGLWKDAVAEIVGAH